MAGSMAVVLREPVETEPPLSPRRNQWSVTFSRFFPYPTITSTCHLLKPLIVDRQFKGTWISSASPSSFLQLSHCPSTSDAILTIRFVGEILEEHYVSKLQYTWPQLQCDPECPVRGSQIVFVSYRDSFDKIQKFALKFSSITEAREFIKAVEDTIRYRNETQFVSSDFPSETSSQSVYMPSSIPPSRNETETLNCDFQSEVSCQSVYIPSSMPLSSSCVREASDTTSVQPYSPELPSSLQYEVEQVPYNKDSASNKICEGVLPFFPPSFTSLVDICYSQSKQGEAQPSSSQESYLKSQIVKYMEDSSFQDMLLKVDKIIGDIGVDLM